MSAQVRVGQVRRSPWRDYVIIRSSRGSAGEERTQYVVAFADDPSVPRETWSRTTVLSWPVVRKQEAA